MGRPRCMMSGSTILMWWWKPRLQKPERVCRMPGMAQRMQVGAGSRAVTRCERSSLSHHLLAAPERSATVWQIAC